MSGKGEKFSIDHKHGTKFKDMQHSLHYTSDCRDHKVQHIVKTKDSEGESDKVSYLSASFANADILTDGES